MATFSPLYGSWTDLTITLASLASDSNLLAGRESTVVNNTSGDFEDYIVGGQITVGTTPTTDTTIEIWVYANVTGTTTYPDVFDGTDSNETVTSAGIKRGSLALAAVLNVDSATSDRTYWARPFSLVQTLGVIPERWGLFVVHDTGVNLNSTGGNHKLSYQGINGESA